MRLPLAMILTCACALPAIAVEQTCKYVDAAGTVLYSNLPQRQARKVFCMDPAPTVIAPRRAASTPALCSFCTSASETPLGTHE